MDSVVTQFTAHSPIYQWTGFEPEVTTTYFADAFVPDKLDQSNLAMLYPHYN